TGVQQVDDNEGVERCNLAVGIDVEKVGRVLPGQVTGSLESQSHSGRARRSDDCASEQIQLAIGVLAEPLYVKTKRGVIFPNHQLLNESCRQVGVEQAPA